jgi:hypothetical protein
LTFDYTLIAQNQVFAVTIVASLSGTELSVEKTISFTYTFIPIETEIHLSSEEDLLALAGLTNTALLGKTYILDNDIILTTPWVGIGVATNDTTVGIPFTGIFDGKGYTISGINIEAGWNNSFFNEIGNTGIVRNTKFSGANYQNGWVGGLAIVNNGLIENCIIDVVNNAETNAALVALHNNGIVNFLILTGSIGHATNNGIFGTNHGSANNLYGNINTVNTDNLSFAEGIVPEDGSILKQLSWLYTADNYDGWDDEIWYIANGILPVLKYDGFVPPSIDLEKSITINTGSSINLALDDTITISYDLINAENGDVVVVSIKEAVNGVSISGAILSFDYSVIAKNTAFDVIIVATLSGTNVSSEKTISFTYTFVPVSNEVHITTEDDFLALSGTTNVALLAKTYILDNDIELSGTWGNFIPIGLHPEGEDGGHAFTGNFYGQGHTISNIKIEAGYGVGIFAEIASSATISNVKFAGGVHGAAWLGGLAHINHGTINNIILDLDVYAGANVSAIVGDNSGSISHVLFFGTVVADEASITLIRNNTGTVTDVYGLDTCGVITPGTGILRSKFWLQSKGNYAGWDDRVWYLSNGAYPSFKYDGWLEPERTITILNNSSYIIKDDDTITLESALAYGHGDESIVYTLGSAVTGVTIDDITLIFDFSAIEESFSITLIVTIVSTEITDTKVINFTYSKSSEPVDERVHITTGQQFVDYLSGQTDAEALGKHYVLDNDIELPNGESWANFSPIGLRFVESSGFAFTGIFDGQGYTISNIKVNAVGDPWNTGIFGEIAAGAIVRNVKFVGNFNNGRFSGGLARTNNGTITDVIFNVEVYSEVGTISALVYENTGIISNVLYLNQIFTEDGTVSLIAINTGTVTAVYADSAISGISVSGFGELKTTEWLKTAENFNGWNDAIWEISNGSYPTLKAQDSEESEPEPDNRIHITNRAELISYLSGQVDPDALAKDYVLDDDIVFEGGWTEFLPIGLTSVDNDGVAFTGTFDGNGHIISNWRYSGGGSIGFFGEIGSTGVVKNVIINGQVNGTNWVAGLAFVNNGTISNCVVDILVYSETSSFGLVGHNLGTIDHVIVIGLVKNDDGEGGEGTGLTSTPGTLTEVYADISSTILAADGDVHIKSNEWLITAENFAEWDHDIWNILDLFLPMLHDPIIS